MIKTCLDYGGIGLAAPQIGIFERMFVIGIDKEQKQWKFYFNPMWKYNLLDKKLVSSEEGCLSVPGKIITVSRYSEITASYETWENGLWTRKEEILSGELAIVYQHEDDHLRATSIVDKLSR